MSWSECALRQESYCLCNSSGEASPLILGAFLIPLNKNGLRIIQKNTILIPKWKRTSDHSRETYCNFDPSDGNEHRTTQENTATRYKITPLVKQPCAIWRTNFRDSILRCKQQLQWDFLKVFTHQGVLLCHSFQVVEAVNKPGELETTVCQVKRGNTVQAAAGVFSLNESSTVWTTLMTYLFMRKRSSPLKMSLTISSCGRKELILLMRANGKCLNRSLHVIKVLDDYTGSRKKATLTC